MSKIRKEPSDSSAPVVRLKVSPLFQGAYHASNLPPIEQYNPLWERDKLPQLHSSPITITLNPSFSGGTRAPR